MAKPAATATIHKSLAGYVVEPKAGDASLVAKMYGVDDLAHLPRPERIFGADTGRVLDWPEVVSFLRTIGNNMDLGVATVGRAALHRTLMLYPRRPKPAPAPIVTVDFDTARYVGDENDGCYYDVARGRRGNKWGWFVTVVVDSDTGGVCMNLVTDDGPYASEWEASRAGKAAALEWCANNDVDPGEDHTANVRT